MARENSTGRGSLSSWPRSSAGAAETSEALRRAGRLARQFRSVEGVWIGSSVAGRDDVAVEPLSEAAGVDAAVLAVAKRFTEHRACCGADEWSIASRVPDRPEMMAFREPQRADTALLVRFRPDAPAEARDDAVKTLVDALSSVPAGGDAELARLRRLLDERSRQFTLSARLAKFGAWSLDVETGMISVSAEFCGICECRDCGALRLDHMINFFAEESRDEILEKIGAATRGAERFEFEASIVTTSGAEKWVRAVCESHCEDGVVTRVDGCVQDITEEVTAREDIVLLASRDYLTEVSNRASFTNLVDNRIRSYDPFKQNFFVLLIDIDDFKTINDSFGHDVGDNVLREVTQILSQSVRSDDLVGRLGGDEFGVFFSGPSSDAGELVAERILTMARESTLLRGIGGGVTVSVGVAKVPSRDSNFKSMLKAADLALYEAKRAGRNCARRYSVALGVEYERRERLMAAVDQALRDGCFEPWYQPKLNLRTGRLEGFEALARWRHPERGVLTPGAFMAALRDVRMATRISERILALSIQQFGELKRRLGRSVGRVAVNMTEKMIAAPSFPERIAAMLSESGLDPSELELEITEAVLLSRNIAELRTSLEAMSEMGVVISLDDFGTGYASLSHLRAFPIDQLKIDMSFIRDLETNRESRIISTAVINMAHDLQMEVVAEGVETAAVQALLEKLGCDLIQGYHVARPAPIEEIETMLASPETRALKSA